MKKILGYIVAYFVGVIMVRWYLTTEEGKGDLAEILEEAGYEYLAKEITDGQTIARYEETRPQVVIPEADPELEAILDAYLWEDVQWSYDNCYYSMTPRRIGLNDGTVGVVVNYNKETGYVQLQLDDANFVDTTIKEVSGRV